MTKRVVLIGHPVAHSLSWAMQQAAFDALGIDATYEAWDRAPIELADAQANQATVVITCGAGGVVPAHFRKRRAAGVVEATRGPSISPAGFRNDAADCDRAGSAVPEAV